MLLSVENLEVKYGNIQALHGISFHVNAGEIVTLIGANGAGKTTSLYAIARLRPPEAPRVTAGDIRFDGQSILKTPPDAVVKDLKLALVPEGRHIFGNLTVQENLELATYSRSKQDDLAQGLPEDLRPLPAPGRAPQTAQRVTLRRRAADARGRPGR